MRQAVEMGWASTWPASLYPLDTNERIWSEVMGIVVVVIVETELVKVVVVVVVVGAATDLADVVFFDVVLKES